MSALEVPTPDDVSQPPMAKKLPTTTTLHGDKRVDDYGWLRDKTSPETIAYLEAENAYADAVMKPTEELQKTALRRDARPHQADRHATSRIARTATSTTRAPMEGKQYPIYARRKRTLDAAEEILLDVNELAEGKKFMSVGAMAVSDDANLLAYTTDDNGYRQYKLHVKDLRTGQDDRRTCAERVGAVEWAQDNKTLFYTRRERRQAPVPRLPPRPRHDRARAGLRGEGRAVRRLRRPLAQRRLDLRHLRQQDHERSAPDPGRDSRSRSRW